MATSLLHTLPPLKDNIFLLRGQVLVYTLSINFSLAVRERGWSLPISPYHTPPSLITYYICSYRLIYIDMFWVYMTEHTCLDFVYRVFLRPLSYIPYLRPLLRLLFTSSLLPGLHPLVYILFTSPILHPIFYSPE